MDFNSSDYFTYKKNKAQHQLQRKVEQPSKAHILLQIFGITFLVFFISVVIGIMKFSTKVDIEYGSTNNRNLINNEEKQEEAPFEEDEAQGKIDKRLNILQQEENAPNEAKIIIDKDKNKLDTEVINPVLLEENKKIEKQVKLEKKAALAKKEALKKEIINTENSQNSENSKQNIIEKTTNKIQLLDKKDEFEEQQTEKNIAINSRILVGRYSSFDEAKSMQSVIKQKVPNSSPFIRKIGEVYSLQMGSYQEFNVAKSHAQKLKSYGLDVWIYQQ